MADIIMKCPLCCDKTFSSKTHLIEHLNNALAKIYCPVCGNKWSTVSHLMEHLKLDNCQPEGVAQTMDTVNLDEGDDNLPSPMLESKLENGKII